MATWIDVLDARVQPVAAQDTQNPVLGDVLEEDLDTLEVHPLVEQRGQLYGRVVGDASCPTIGDGAVRVERREIAARSDVPLLQVELDADRRQDPTAELVCLGVVPEQGEVARTGADRNAGHEWVQEPDRARCCQPVEVGGLRLLQLRVVRGIRESAESVNHQQQDLARGVVEDL